MIDRDIKAKCIVYSICSLGIFLYGTINIYIGRFGFGKHTKVYITGLPAWVFYVAVLCFSFTFIALIFDAFSKNNDQFYFKTAKGLVYAGCIVAGVAFFIGLLQDIQG